KDRVQGTPEYMAPEQAKNKIVNEQTDIYNLGATMYRLVTWRKPPNVLVEAVGVPLNTTTWKKLVTPVGALAKDAPSPLCDLLHRCMAFSPTERPERVNDLLPELEHLVQTLVVSEDDRLEAVEWE